MAGCGALKALGGDHGEIKSMRVHPDYRGQGVGKAILLHLLAEAKSRSYARVSLETVSHEPFVPARRLYGRHGFIACPPFADYGEDPFSHFMTLEIA